MEKEFLNKEDINFIKALLKKEYKTGGSLLEEEKNKLNLILKLLNLSSFEEVLRKCFFFNILDKNEASKEYFEYVEKFSKKRISNSILIRNFMFDCAKASAPVFSEFCYNTHHFDDIENKDDVNYTITKIKTDDSVQKMFSNVQNFIDLINSNSEFEKIFNTIFKLNSFENKNFSSTIFEIFSSLSCVYLYIVRCNMETLFPVQLKRSLDISEKDLIRFLLYYGDEIDYMKKNNISYIEYQKLVFDINRVFSADNIEQSLISALLYDNFYKNCLVYDYYSWQIRANMVLINKNEFLNNAEQKYIKANDTIEAIEEILEDKIFCKENLEEYLNLVKDIPVYDYFTLNRTDFIHEWFNSHGLNLDLIAKIQKAVFYTENL